MCAVHFSATLSERDAERSVGATEKKEEKGEAGPRRANLDTRNGPPVVKLMYSVASLFGVRKCQLPGCEE